MIPWLNASLRGLNRVFAVARRLSAIDEGALDRGKGDSPEIPAGGVLQVGSPAPTGSTAADPAGSLPSAAPLTPVPGAVPALTFTPTPVPAPLAPGATGGQPRTVQPPVTRSELPAYDDDDDDDDDERDDDDD